MITIIVASVFISMIKCQSEALSVKHSQTRSRRSVGSLPTSIENYPYLVSVRNCGTHFCGGTILTKDIILTAAQCIDDLPLDLLTVKVGSADINYKGTWHSATKVIKYEEKKKLGSRLSSGINDIALIKLETPIDLNNETTQIVQLFESDDDVHDYDRGIAIGWGNVPVIITESDTNDNESEPYKMKIDRFPSKLMAVELNIASKNKCSEINPKVDLENRFCTYSLGRKPCGGDVGGPFIINERQAGIPPSEKIHEFWEKLKERLQGAAEKGKEKAEELKHAFEEARGKIEQDLAEKRKIMAEKLEKAKELGEEKAKELKEKLEKDFEQGRERLQEKFEEIRKRFEAARDEAQKQS
ncbi:hypothetical protein QAD02_008764 [Eretmocerus hayati]|uniref:Uncharacterized protein n=1 Tax=Eretmocerus hayati TaxID=131215 RepID=A0ACC2N7Q5_9HYME|nr:hypothetical protein QAD02_008764 [Eretmocerus hayati]